MQAQRSLSLDLERIPPLHLERLQHAAKIYACANSLLLRQPATDPDGVDHVPFCLFPTPFPRDQFDKVVRIQASYNRLYCNLASSPEIITQVLEESISQVDPFVGGLYQLWKKLVVQEPSTFQKPRCSLGIFRNDYLLHQSSPADRMEIKQIEFNTVSVSFGSLASKVSDLHRYIGGLSTTFDQYKLPVSPNEALRSLGQALRMAHNHYRLTESGTGRAMVMLMIVKPNERNIFDQSLIEYELSMRQEQWEIPIRMIRVSYDEILRCTSVDPTTQTLIYHHHPEEKHAVAAAEVSVVYYRSMYGPEDYTSEDDWKARYQLESSRAINCPDLSFQLVGCKKFQQVLTDADFLESHRAVLTEGIDEEQWETIRSTWTVIHPLDRPAALGIASDPTLAPDWVLKPQREGGGHNVYGSDIPSFVEALSESERKAYILMKLVKPPSQVFNYFVRPASPDPDEARALHQVVSELGIFGFCLLRHQPPSPSASGIVFNFQAGHLLRTKKSGAQEGGLAIGISCLDSPLLV